MSHLALTDAQQRMYGQYFSSLGPIYPVDEATAVIIKSASCPVPGYRGEMYMDSMGHIIEQYLGGRNIFSGWTKFVPIPTKTTYTFKMDQVIRKIFFPVVSEGFFTERTGGVGQRTWSIVFESQNSTLKPIVEVSVLKKEYYAARLVELNTSKLASMTALVQLQQSRAQTESNLRQLKATIALNEQEKIAVAPQLAQVEREVATTRTSLAQRKGEMEKSLQKLKEEGGKITALGKFLTICPKIDFPIESAEITAFQGIFHAVKAVLDAVEDPHCLFSKISNSLSPLLNPANGPQQQELIGVLGPTEAGKSTLVNHLLNVPLVYRNHRVEAADPAQEIAKIGHTTVSETLLANIYSAPGSPFVFADCGGLFDTRGILENILTVASAKLILSNASNLRLVFCMDVSFIRMERGNKLIESLKILRILLKGINQNDKSTLVLFTHPYFDPLTEECVSNKTILGQLEGLAQSRAEKEEAELVRFLLRDKGKYVRVYNPLADSSKEEVSKLLIGLDRIENPKEAIQGSYSTDTVRRVKEEAIPLAHSTVREFQAYKNARELFEQFKNQEAQLMQRKAQLETRVTAANRLIQENEARKIVLERELANLSTQIRLKTSEADRTNMEITKLNTEDLVTFQGNGSSWTIKP
ncbi:MAG: 50S ribosome-binding GTPase [Verrucomicrobia bacterium]|nr:50S ribosome-binding GTPase [Verrucomicrobiota bacterium]